MRSLLWVHERGLLGVLLDAGDSGLPGVAHLCASHLQVDTFPALCGGERTKWYPKTLVEGGCDDCIHPEADDGKILI